MNKQLLEETIVCARELYEQGVPTGYTDEEYDGLERALRKIDPLNPLLNQTGSAVRGGKVPLPIPMNGINQVHVGDVEQWLQNNMYNKLIATDKLDGVSILLHYQNQVFVAAYSRGNGTEGADVTRHATKLGFPKRIKPCELPLDIGHLGHNIFVRAEVIISVDNFNELNRHHGNKYKNPRNFVAGQMNREEAIEDFFPAASVVAYSVYDATGMQPLFKREQLSYLSSCGFEVPSYEIIATANESSLIELLNWRRRQSKYELDGLVLTTGPATCKFKVQSANNTAVTTVDRVEWNVSKDGYFKPTVVFDPVVLMGATITRATGFNAAFIKTNGIGRGAVIGVTRSGEVIPFIERVHSSVEPEFPCAEYEWTESEIDIFSTESSAESMLMKAVHCFRALGVKGAGEEYIRAVLQSCGSDATIIDVLRLSKSDWTAAIGTNGEKIYNSLVGCMSEASAETLGDALGTFGRGVGTRKLAACTDAGVDFVTASVDQLIAVPGISDKTAQKIVAGQTAFIAACSRIGAISKVVGRKLVQEAVGDRFVGAVWQFTGVRDPDLQKAFEADGGKIGSKFTVLVAKDPTANSTKLKTARDRGAEVITLAEARRRVFG